MSGGPGSIAELLLIYVLQYVKFWCEECVDCGAVYGHMSSAAGSRHSLQAGRNAVLACWLWWAQAG